jgi:two-component system, NtrC family, sensor kinase
MIDECGEQASEIFEDFLDFIKETPVKKLPVSLNKVIDDALKLTESRNTNNTVVINKNIPDNLMTEGDESKLKRIVMNLVNNAIDALLDNKIFRPSIDIIAKTDKTLNQVALTIRDNGLGIHPEIAKTLFEPFVTKQKNNGTGLGLAIVKQYVIAHGGEIKVDNDNGAVFIITLPLKK